MTMPVVLETARKAPLRRRIAARVAVGAAWLLVRLSPSRLRKVLELASRGARQASAREASEARQAVISVSVQCAGQGCLQRSVATVLLARMVGLWPVWCTGVITEPFRAHAWVEVDGVPIDERAEIASYHKMMVVSAG
jgi:hypothetical protein